MPGYFSTHIFLKKLICDLSLALSHNLAITVVTEKLCVLLFPLNIPKKPQKYYKNQYKPLNNPKITQSD